MCLDRGSAVGQHVARLLPARLAHGEQALDRLRADRRLVGDDLALVGYSKGAEAALLVAARRSDIRRVVAYAPSAHAWDAARMDPHAAARSSWTWGGRPVPFALLDIDPLFYEGFDKTLLLTRTGPPALRATTRR